MNEYNDLYFSVRGLIDGKLQQVAVFNPEEFDSWEEARKAAHEFAWVWANEEYPGEVTHSCLPSYYNGQRIVVTDGDYLGRLNNDPENPAFHGQFQWIEGGIGSYVPVIVDEVDPHYVEPPKPTPEEEAALIAEMNSSINRSAEYLAEVLRLPENRWLKKAVQVWDAIEGKSFQFGGFEEKLSMIGEQTLQTWRDALDVVDDMQGGASGSSMGFAIRKAAAIIREDNEVVVTPLLPD
jgi:hypothetical protein